MRNSGKLFTATLFSFLLFSSCASMPKGAVTVTPFDLDRYLGKWYEIARFDFQFEKNLRNTTAEYSKNADGTVAVKNRGFNYVTNKWEQAIGNARFRSNPTKAELEVSFFGPFYAGYNVIALDSDYKYALVAGGNLKLLWILSRETTIPEDVKARYLEIAKNLGYDVSTLVWVEHKE